MFQGELTLKANLAEALIPSVIHVDDLLLDPNNARFPLYDQISSTNKIGKKSVQDTALERMSAYGLEELKDSISNVGFLPIDHIVVVKHKHGENRFVVIEGNRRAAAIKSLLKEVSEGLELDEKILNSLTHLNVLVLDGLTYDDSSDYKLLVQGIRHISGVSSWKPYPQARALIALVDNLNYKVTEASKILGLGRNKASWMIKAFYAFEDMRNDEEIDVIKDETRLTSFFSYFIELLKDPKLREYFEWNDDKFCNRTELLKLYRWIGIFEEQEGDNNNRQIPGALDIRKLSSILESPKAKRALETGSSISDAAFFLEDDYKVDSTTKNHSIILEKIYSELFNLPSSFIKRMSINDKEVLEKILKITEEHLN
ncbi:Uncharacterised protein [Priestia megaterium]|uniref:ParB/RepB/Spo0J family partition protein n=1 Tax=Priestia megaterium TaxID=1404 RepID=UPI000E16BB8F|nr:ParB/Srx family N-terminal domain-containing protein [Priestia megaterium]SUV06407.1 Uncharacterised protein [Priestia megaterium]